MSTARATVTTQTTTPPARRRTACALTLAVAIAMLALLPASGAVPAQASSNTQRSSTERLITWDPKREGAVFLKNVRRDHKIPGAPKAFRARLRSELRHVWKSELAGAPECKQVAGIQVWSLRTDGYALGNVVSRVGDTGCGAGASGAVVFWAERNGAWKRVIETADVVKCQALERFDFPSELGVDQCLDGNQVVDYHHD